MRWQGLSSTLIRRQTSKECALKRPANKPSLFTSRRKRSALQLLWLVIACLLPASLYAAALDEDLKVGIDIGMSLLLTMPLAILAVVFVRLHRLQEKESDERQHLLQELAENERHFRFIAENSADVIWLLDIDSLQMSYISPSVQELLGYTPAEVMEKKVFSLVTPDAALRLEELLSNAVERWNAGEQHLSKRILQVDHVHKDGHLVHVEIMTTLHANSEGKLVSILGVTRDISERHANDEMMHHLAFYDALTGLPNRRLLEDRLRQTIAMAQRESQRFTLLFVDLDKFKPINDSYGHAVGDWLLKEVASTLEVTLRASDTVARLGGDEFVIILPKVETTQSAMRVAAKVHEQLETPFETDDGLQLRISCCIGVCLYPLHGTTPKQLLKHADHAMYQAKESGGKRTCLFVALPEEQQPTDNPGEGVSLHLFWRESYSSGNELIDHEHQQLFAQTNALLRTLLSPAQEKTKIEQQLTTLLQGTASHFASEERLLAEMNYPELEQHKIEHDCLLQKARMLKEAASRGELSAGEVIDYVAREIVQVHMLKEDRKYFPLTMARSNSSLP